MTRRMITWSWGNWTFGFWKSKRLRAWGIDLGPLEVSWKKVIYFKAKIQ